MLNVAIDEAVDHSAPDLEDKQKEGQEMRRFASNLVETVVNKVKDEIYPAYLQMLEGESTNESVPAEPHTDEMLEHLYEEGELERPETGIDEELVMAAAQAMDSPRTEGSRRRSVRFSFDDAVIPSNDDEVLGLDTLCLKPVAEHHVTPVPSPIPHEMRDYAFRYMGDHDDDKPSKVLAESLMLRLLDDVNNHRLDKEGLIKVTCYCMEIPRGSDSTEGKAAFKSGRQIDLENISSARITDDLVEFTLGKILEEVKSEVVDKDELTALTISLVSNKHNHSDFYVYKSGNDLNCSSESCSRTAINQIGAEVINQTILSIREGKLSRYYLQTLANELSEEKSVGARIKDASSSASYKTGHSKKSLGSLGTFVVDVLEEVTSDIKKGFVNYQIVENIVQQLALLPVDKTNYSEQDEILELIKCALDRTVSENINDGDPQTTLTESCEKGCCCPATDTSGVVKCAISRTVNDDKEQQLNPKHSGLDPGESQTFTSSGNSETVITVNSQSSHSVDAPEAPPQISSSRNAEVARTVITHGVQHDQDNN